MFTRPTTVRMFGALHALRRERGLEPTTEVSLPAEGCSASELARCLDLPLEKIDGVFINHHACGLDHMVEPGDRVAFVPVGLPTPERVLLGIKRTEVLTSQ